MRLAVSCLTALGLALPAAAMAPPVPPPTFHYYGPVRLCDPSPAPFYSIDVLEGEAGNQQTRRIGVREERGGFGVSPIPGSGISRMLPDDAEPIGSLEDRDAGTLQRVRMRDGEIRYRIQRSEDRYADRIELRATAFDGTERDLEIIGRFRFGEAARAACADVPAALAATPERREELASWLSPKRHRGPLTLCWNNLALDVGADESVLLPWYRDHKVAMIEDGEQQVAVTAAIHSAGSPLAWPDLAGAVIDDPRFTQVYSESGLGRDIGDLLPGRAAARVRLMTRSDRERFGPQGGGFVSFSFARAPSEGDRVAFVARLRGQTPADRCFDPDRQ